MPEKLAALTIEELLARWPFADQFFADRGIEIGDDPDLTLAEVIAAAGDPFTAA